MVMVMVMYVLRLCMYVRMYVCMYVLIEPCLGFYSESTCLYMHVQSIGSYISTCMYMQMWNE